MTQYLLVLSIGPVQSMIAAARRSRDLWSGSWLLSELSKACAKSLYEREATLIFPFINKDTDKLKENSPFSVGNKIQAIVEAENTTKLQEIIQKAKDAAYKRFEKEADLALEQLDGEGSEDIRHEIWNKQKSNYVEIQAAWVVIKEEDGYKNAVQKIGETLAARKATRDFNPSAIHPYERAYMLPKSSLDGTYETVIHESKKDLKSKKDLRQKISAKLSLLSLAKSEQLDCLGVVKRLGFKEKAEQFTPFTRIAAHAWIEELIEKGVDLSEITNIYEKLVSGLESAGEKVRVATRVKGNKGTYQNFPYDGQFLYPYRLEAAIKECQISEKNNDNKEKVIGQLEELKKQLHPIWKEYDEPYSYGVMLLADGDRMGELLDKAKTQADHQLITKALSKFAKNVADIMRKHNGHCIYAGGDDVLGFVPLDTAYACADELQNSFSKSLNGVANQLGAEKAPTLSVGLAICHIMTPMGVIRDLAKQAEKHAKGDDIQDNDKRRNALSLLLSVRSGSDIKIRYQWSDDEGLAALKQSVQWYKDNRIPSRVAYDIRDIYLRTQYMAHDNPDLHKNIQSAELTRMLKQARTKTGDKIDAGVIEQIKARGEKIGLDVLADELIVARWMAAKTQKELGKE